MVDYKNSDWWKELNSELSSFDDSQMSDGQLNKWNGAVRAGFNKGKIQGPKNVENKFWENLTSEQRSMGGITSGNKRKLMDDWKDMASIAGKVSGKNRGETKLQKYKTILNLIKTDTFVTSDLRNACREFGYNDTNPIWKKILKTKELVVQIYKGENQFNPSVYKKI